MIIITDQLDQEELLATDLDVERLRELRSVFGVLMISDFLKVENYTWQITKNYFHGFEIRNLQSTHKYQEPLHFF